ncbi:MAG: hypothetical protein WCE45_05125, partial [Sedimentisphaerales bacterium]
MALSKIKPQIANLLTKAISKTKTISEAEEKKQNAKTDRANADAKRLIAKIKSKADQKRELYSQIISKVKSEFEQLISRVRTQAQEAIDRVRAESAEKEKSYEERISQIEAEAKRLIAQEQAKAQET